MLFLLFKQTGRVTLRPPSKRQGFQARAGARSRTRPRARACARALFGACADGAGRLRRRAWCTRRLGHGPPAGGASASAPSEPPSSAPAQVRAFAQEHGLGNPAAGLFVFAQAAEE